MPGHFLAFLSAPLTGSWLGRIKLEPISNLYSYALHNGLLCPILTREECRLSTCAAESLHWAMLAGLRICYACRRFTSSEKRHTVIQFFTFVEFVLFILLTF